MTDASFRQSLPRPPAARLRAVTLIASLLALTSAAPAPAAPPRLQTLAEQSGWQRTGRYAEVERLCPEFAAAYPAHVRCLRFGQTPEGRPMLALVAAQDIAREADPRTRRQPVVLAQGGIHAGEIDGKDAGFLLLRELLDTAAGRALLGQLTLLLVPVFNVDGHERFGPNHRPNQRGPAEMGFRVTAQNLNLNRDYMKAESPEMQALLPLLHAWDPLLYADLHVTDGADFQPAVALQVEPRHTGPDALRRLGAELSARVLEGVRARGVLALDFYPELVVHGDPRSGFSAEVSGPRLSNGYWPLHNRFSALVETHSWKDYATRVRVTHDVLHALLVQVAADAPRLVAATRAADEADLRLGGQEVALQHEPGPRETPLRFPGYAYTLEPSPVSGAVRVRYDPRQPRDWDVPFRPDLVVSRAARAPAAGYLVPPAYAALVLAKLRLHGLRAFRVTGPEPAPPQPAQVSAEVSAEIFRAATYTFRPAPFEARQLVTVEGGWRPEEVALRSGALYVPVGQRGGRLVVHLLEPTAPDSLLAWGFLNATFEQKEYMEDYVTEAVAESMLAKSPALRSEFTQRLAADPAFARDPAARLRFFSERHPSFDDQRGRYPIARLGQAPDAARLSPEP